MSAKQWIGLVILAHLTFASVVSSESPVKLPDGLRLPLGLSEQALHIPQDNPLMDKMVDLGWQLFFDRRLSADETMACSTCHIPALGFSDGQPLSNGLKERKPKRNVPTVINMPFGNHYFWDGRASSLEEVILLTLPAQLGITHEAIVQKLARIEGYAEQFQRVLGTPVTTPGIATAIAAFVRTIFSSHSPFDRFNMGDREALPLEAQRGFKLFKRKAQCAKCHRGFNFTDEQFHNTGIGLYDPDPDLGRYDITKLDEDKGAFKTPTLRDLALTAPYMHDGSFKTLEEVIQFFDEGGIKNPYLDPKLRPLHLTPQEKADLLAFLNSLTGTVVNILAPRLPN